MEYYNNQTPPPYYEAPSHEQVVAQTNSVLKRVYVRMFIGLLVTAFTALGVASSEAAMTAIFGNQIVFWGMLIAMLAMAFIIPGRLTKMSTGTTLVLFLVYSCLMGAWLAPIFHVYTLGSIAYTFFICAGMFGGMSIYGYFTKTNLSRFGTYMVMALIGLFIMMIVNMFVASSGLDWIISIIGVLLFTGLTAWDTQQIKQLASANIEPSMTDKLATLGAMNLYLDFINLFLFLLRIFGGGRD